jgi:glycosyltransferase involved in cell wall biosynthesis
MPETAGGAALLADPEDPVSIGQAIVRALEADGGRRERGLLRAGEFTWRQTAKETLEVYREVHARQTAGR